MSNVVHTPQSRFEQFAERVQAGGTLTDADVNEFITVPWWRRLGNWLLAVFDYE